MFVLYFVSAAMLKEEGGGESRETPARSCCGADADARLDSLIVAWLILGVR